MDPALLQDLQNTVKGEVYTDSETLKKYSHDASILEINPSCVVAPKDLLDVQNVVKFVNLNKKEHPELSITARSAGTDMSGGSLGESIVLSFTEHLNKISGITDNLISTEPGVYYRDFEKITLNQGLLFPPYPVSKDICAVGGMVGNNCGGEKSFEYGKTERYVKKLKMVLSDGNEYEFKNLSEDELKEKLSKTDYEGNLYRQIYHLINDNYNDIQDAKPKVSKNSSGYSLWNVYNRDTKTFDLTQLFTGAQGTLGIMTEVTFKLVPRKLHSQMVVIYLNAHDIEILGEIINTVLPFAPESFETYDDNTLKLAIKYFPEFGKKLGTSNIISTAFLFLPEILMYIKGKLPKLTLQAEFTGDDPAKLKEKASGLVNKINCLGLKTKMAGDESQSKKYWLIRRESFSLLKNKITDKHAAPFIDDFIVEPRYLSEFLPKFNAIMAKYPSFTSTIAGHIGDGNFHIIPLVKMEDEKERKLITSLSTEVFDLVLSYHGSTSGEHNDGVIRTPFLKQSYGEKVYNLFLKTKNIFDPNNIFNPGKKTTISNDYAASHIRTSW